MDLKRQELVAIVDGAKGIVKPGSDSSLRKYNSFVSKIKHCLGSDVHSEWSLKDEVCQLNFEKYADELARLLGAEAIPKRTSGILSLLELVVILSAGYDGFYKVYYETLEKVHIHPLISLLKRSPSSAEKSMVRFILEAAVIGMKGCMDAFSAVLSATLKSTDYIESTTLISFISKMVYKMDSDAFPRVRSVAEAVYKSASTLSDLCLGHLKALHIELSSLTRKSKHIFETKGDLSSLQTQELLKRMEAFDSLFRCYEKFVDHFSFQPAEYVWSLETPEVDNGRIIFMDRSIDEDMSKGAFMSQEETEFYLNLSLPHLESHEYEQFSADAVFGILESANSMNDVDRAAALVLHTKISLNVGFSEGIVALSKARIDQIPLLCRFLAHIQKAYDDVVCSVVRTASGQYRFLLRQKASIAGMRARVAKFVGELGKFGLIPQSEVYMLLRKCADDLDSFNADLLAQTLVCVGQYLYSQPESRRRMEHLFRLLSSRNSKLLISESVALDGVLRTILGDDTFGEIRCETVETSYISHLLHCPGSKLDKFSDILKVVQEQSTLELAQALFDQRSICSVSEEHVCELLTFLLHREPAVPVLFWDSWLVKMQSEWARFPYTDIQLCIRSFDLVLCACEFGLFPLNEVENVVVRLFEKCPTFEDEYEHWGRFCYRILHQLHLFLEKLNISDEFHSIKSAVLRLNEIWCGLDDLETHAILRRFLPVQGLEQHPSNRSDSPVVQATDSFAFEEELVKAVSSAVEERRLLDKKEESFICVGIAPKSTGHKFIVLKSKGKRQFDIKPISISKSDE